MEQCIINELRWVENKKSSGNTELFACRLDDVPVLCGYCVGGPAEGDFSGAGNCHKSSVVVTRLL